MNLDIYIENFAQFLMQSNTAALSRILASAHWQRQAVPLQGTLLKDFEVDPQSDWPAAALIAIAHGLENHQDYYLLAYLVHLDLRTDYFSAQSLSDISSEHSDAIIDCLNLHFQDRQLFFSPTTHPSMMLISTPQLPLINTQNLSDVEGKDVRNYLPAGEDALHWRMMMNEMQMLLHAHPANLEREQQQQLAINSLWLEGGGRLPSRSMKSNTTLMSNHDMVRGLARFSACEHLELVASFAELEYHDHLVIWMQANPELESLWFEPLLEALRGATVKHLNLYFSIAGNTYHLTLKPLDVWKFWRRTKPLSQYFVEIEHAS